MDNYDNDIDKLSTGLVTLYLVHALPHLQGLIFSGIATTLIITLISIILIIMATTMMMIMTMIRSPAQDIPDIYWGQAFYLLDLIIIIIIAIKILMMTAIMIMTTRSPAQDIPDIYWEQAARELDFCTCRKCQVCLHCVVVNIVIVVVELNNCRKCQVCHHHTVDDDCHHVADDGNDELMKKA